MAGGGAAGANGLAAAASVSARFSRSVARAGRSVRRSRMLGQVRFLQEKGGGSADRQPTMRRQPSKTPDQLTNPPAGQTMCQLPKA
eukprot:364165-Chlamydomonas_euryale.AAC.12